MFLRCNCNFDSISYQIGLTPPKIYHLAQKALGGKYETAVLVGVLVFELMKVALQFMNVNSSYTYIVQGLVIIVAVAIDIRKYLAKK